MQWLTTKEGSLGALGTLVNEIMINTAAIIVQEDCQIIVDGMADMLHVSHSSAFTIVHDHLNMRHVFARWVLRLLISKTEADASRGISGASVAGCRI